jgi:hypothetical protein
MQNMMIGVRTFLNLAIPNKSSERNIEQFLTPNRFPSIQYIDIIPFDKSW